MRTKPLLEILGGGILRFNMLNINELRVLFEAKW